ncbi:MAG TPA: low molecular weight protein-tyrosine-phosphatase [Steroidobacteraceae bacterium]|nr:low molecular weight protein-tyrosine-phosphatase [Steroidobacteraceae bacterium]
MSERQIAVLFVCLGNICRSPTAEAVLRTLASREAPDLRLHIDSAGTADYHVGRAPDLRAQEAARRRGYDMADLRARNVEPDDFESFDLILAMDRDNHAALIASAPRAMHPYIRLFLEFAPDADTLEVPDPYYGGPNGFEHVLDLIEAAARGLLSELKNGKALR